MQVVPEDHSATVEDKILEVNDIPDEKHPVNGEGDVIEPRHGSEGVKEEAPKPQRGSEAAEVQEDGELQHENEGARGEPQNESEGDDEESDNESDTESDSEYTSAESESSQSHTDHSASGQEVSSLF